MRGFQRWNQDGAHGRIDELPRDVFVLFPGADVGGQDKEVFASAEFFVDLDGFEDALKKAWAVRVANGQGGAEEEGLESLEKEFGAGAEGDGEAGGGDHADGDGFAVGECVVGGELQAVADRMSEI